MWRDLWAYRKRGVIGAAGLLAALLAVTVIAIAAVGGSGGRPEADATRSPTAGGRQPSAPGPAPHATGYDRAAWSAAPSVPPVVSAPYPALPGQDRTQPDLFAAAFGCEMLTRDYRDSTRDQLLAWAQASSAPLTIVQVPMSQADRATSLVTSLVTSGWDTDETGTPVVSQGQWLSLSSQQAFTTVTDIEVQTVSDFPPPRTTFTEATFDRLVTATVTLHSRVSGVPAAAQSSVAFEVVVSDHDGRLGAAEVQHWVTRSLP